MQVYRFTGLHIQIHFFYLFWWYLFVERKIMPWSSFTGIQVYTYKYINNGFIGIIYVFNMKKISNALHDEGIQLIVIFFKRHQSTLSLITIHWCHLFQFGFLNIWTNWEELKNNTNSQERSWNIVLKSIILQITKKKM